MGLTLPIPGPLQYGNSGTDIRIVVHGDRADHGEVTADDPAAPLRVKYPVNKSDGRAKSVGGGS